MLTNLSRRQHLYLVLTLFAAVAIMAVGWGLQGPADQTICTEFSVDMNIKQVAPALDVTGKSLARELCLFLDVSKSKPLKALGVNQEQLDHATEHILGHRETTLKYYIFGALVLFGLVYLVRLGRPDKTTIEDRKAWYPRWPKPRSLPTWAWTLYRSVHGWRVWNGTNASAGRGTRSNRPTWSTCETRP